MRKKRQMIEYVVLGTPYPKQELCEFEKPVMDAIQKHAIKLIAEEYAFDNPSRVCVATKRLHVPYLQIDLFPQESPLHGIDREMEMRERVQFLREQDCRLSHADAVREDFWLEKIEASMDRGRVLIICGYLHLDFLAQRAGERGGRVVEKSAFPPELRGVKPTIVLSLAKLEEYLRKQGEAGA
jgi:hypothetical protein